MCPLLGQQVLVVGVEVGVGVELEVELSESVQGREDDDGSIVGQELRDVGWAQQAYRPRVQGRLENRSRVQFSEIGQ